MKSFPMFFRTTGRRVVIAGGGEQAAQKARLLMKTDAEIVLLADALDDELQGIVAEGRARQVPGHIAPESFRGAALVFVATGSPGADAALHALAKAAGATVNVVDRPELCDMTTPSIVDRDPLVVAIGTEGNAPVLGRTVKTRIEEMLDPRLGSYAALAGRLRDAVAQRVPQNRRRPFWRWAFTGAAWQAHRRGADREAARLLKEMIAAGGEVPDLGGQIAFVGAGPGPRDLLTLRAVERLQEADAIYFDRSVDPQVLELARRDAERVSLGGAGDAFPWPAERIGARIVAEAAAGARIVRLTAGDPAERLSAEIAAARRDGIAHEIVPGIIDAPLRAAGAAGD